MIGPNTINLTITKPTTVAGPFTYEIRYMPADGGAEKMMTNVSSPFMISGLDPVVTYTITVSRSALL